MSERTMESDLVAWGKAIRLETTGRRSGLARAVTIGYVETSGRSMLVAAAADTTHWAQNLRAESRCIVELGAKRWPCLAVELEGPDRAEAVAALILKYGTPAERLGAGPAFRLEPRP